MLHVHWPKALPYTSHSQGLAYLKEQGFKVSPGYQVCDTPKAVWEAIEAIGNARDGLSYDILEKALEAYNNERK